MLYLQIMVENWVLCKGVIWCQSLKELLLSKKDEISEVVESKFGYHIIQMIERRGEQINVRHILIKPKFSSLSLQMQEKK